MRFSLLMPFFFVLACSSDSTNPDINNGVRDPNNPLRDGGNNGRKDGDSPDGSERPDSGNLGDSGKVLDMGSPDTTSTEDTGVVVEPDPPVNWPSSRAWTWIRNNEPFISGLTVDMDPPPQDEVDKYFGDFGATAVHLWQNGAPVKTDGWRARTNKPWLAWTNFEGKSQNGQVIGGYPANESGRIGWQVGDEPRTQADWLKMKLGMEAVRSADPDGVIVANFSFSADDITRFLAESCATEMDVLSYDKYTLGHSSYEVLAQMRDASIKCGIPYWRYMSSYVDMENDRPVYSESDMRWDAMSGVVYGFTGHTWFLYKIAGGGAQIVPTTLFTVTNEWNQGNTTAQYDHAKKINRELLAYGKAVNHLVSNDVRIVPSLIAPAGLKKWTQNAGGDPYLKEVSSGDDVILGFFQDIKRDYYVIAMNPYHTHGKFPTKGDKTINVSFDLDFSSATGIDQTRVKILNKNGSISNQPVAGGSFSASIPAGEILFFKYDSGRPFAGY